MLNLLILSAFAQEPEIVTNVKVEVRPQFWSNPDFDSNTDDQIWSVKQSSRIAVTANAGKVELHTSVQDYRIWGGEDSPFFNKDSLITMHEGYAQFALLENSWFKIGRQEYELNDGRILWTAPWTLFDRSYDGARFYSKGDKWEYNLFAGISRSAENFSTTCDDSLTDCADFVSEDHSSQGDYFLSSTLKLKLNDAFQVNPYVLAVIQDASAAMPEQNSQVYSVGAFAKGKPTGEISYSAEGIYQFGQESTDVEQSAWLVAADLGYHQKGRGASVFYEESSGDGDATDTVNNDFDAFQGARHKFRGFADVIGTSNVRDYGVKTKFKLNKKTTIIAAAHHFELSNPEGYWYSIKQQPIGGGEVGNEDSVIGNELDFLILFKPYKGVSIQLVEAIFSPSGYGAKVTEGDLTTTTFLWMKYSL